MSKYVNKLLVDGGYAGGSLYNPITVDNRHPFDVSLLEQGQINKITCAHNRSNVNLGTNGVGNLPSVNLENYIIVGDGCNFSFDSSTSFSDTIIATNETGNQTFSGGPDVVLGAQQSNCDPGGEVSLITKGNVRFSAKLSAYDLEIIAQGDVHLAAHANAMGEHYGTNISAGGDVFVTTGHTFRGCEGNTVSVFDPVMSWALVL